jgi:4-diphosphocytidyl-2-C-methyl-D-erythritol kinase
MQNQVRQRALAKVNLCLHIAGRRPDGYHELRTIFQSISLHDTLEMERTREAGVSLECSDPELPRGPENLVWRAIEAASGEIGFKGGVRARLTKRIPAARGLGGGSSDAAAAMVALLRLSGARLRLARAMEIAAGLGADVPFFLLGGRALGVGRGDEVYPLPDAPKRSVLVVSPRDIGVNTREAYAWLSSELTKREKAPNMWGFCALCWSRQESGVSNDFEAPVFGRHARLESIKRALLERGAAEAALAGSGSAVFGVFRSPAQARRAARSFPKDQVFPVETLSREEYGRFVRTCVNKDGDLLGRR